MYRLINSSQLSLNNIKILTKNCINCKTILSSELEPNAMCVNKFNRNLYKEITFKNIRCTSTSSNAENIIPKTKRKRPNYSKYVELLQVTNLSTKQIRTKVKNLKAKKLSDFLINQPDFVPSHDVTNSRIKSTKKIKETKLQNRPNKLQNQPIEYQKMNFDIMDSSIFQSGTYDDRAFIFLGKNYKKRIDENSADTKLILKSFQNFKDMIETLEHSNTQETDETYDISASSKMDLDKLGNELIEPIDEDQTSVNSRPKLISTTNIDNKKTDNRYKSKYHVSFELEQKAKQKATLINLISYMNVCVATQMFNRGLSTILIYRPKYKKNNYPANTIPIEIFNILLHGYAEKGTIDKIEFICTILDEDNIKWNYQTFAACLECLGRNENCEKNRQSIENYISKADNMGISLDMIMDESKFHGDQRDIILETIRRVQPDFQPIYTPPNIDYVNPLLKELNQNLSHENNCHDQKNRKSKYSPAELIELAKNQLKVELNGSLTVESIENSKDVEYSEQCRTKYKELQDIWRTQICLAINRDLNTLRAQIRYKAHGAMTYYTYIKALDTGQYADILLNEIRMLAEGSETFSPTVGQLFKELGRKVHSKYQIEQKKQNGILEKTGEIYSEYCTNLELMGKCGNNPRQLWQRLVHEHRKSGPSMDTSDCIWPTNVLLGVGRFLYNILMRDIKIDANILRTNPNKTKFKQHNLLPAFYTLFRNQGRLVKEEVKPHPVLARLLRGSQQKTLTFDSNVVPMLCPPQPWSTIINGGYLLTKSELIRLPQQAVQQWHRINDSNPQDIYPALDSLNQLSSIPWKVNTDVLDIIIDVFQRGGDSKLDVSRPPHSLPPLPTVPTNDPSLTNVQRAKLFRDKMGHRRKQAEMYSLWCDTLYRLSLANHYRDRVFWLPHNMDFRGRVYPLPPHLNHLGSDLARSLLVFDEAQPLGPDGLMWLKLHCINLTGSKKRDSVRERLLYAEDVMSEIIDSAENPLTGRQWWAKSDEPWQTLACCMEIAKVSKCPEPEKYLSRFPVHQDGSCNGLQHYAALGRDTAGAFSVNLSPSSLPQDVYSSVAILVEKMRKTDAKNGLHVAEILDGYVRRKVIKQTVMTTVYGVTRYGARLQIARQLKDIDEFPKEWVWPASSYLTTKTFESLREMFTSTKEIQDWLTDCARLISSVCQQNVEWITPLGLPVVQPYNRMDQFKNTIKNTTRINETMSMDMYEKPNIMKQKNAFPPNFIHSLDSSHMMLTSLFCERHGITFISVHDCFWTHACTVPDMNKICRDQFVALHSQPIIEELSKFLNMKYAYPQSELNDLSKRKLNKTITKLPPKGDFELENILDSVYFFS